MQIQIGAEVYLGRTPEHLGGCMASGTEEKSQRRRLKRFSLAQCQKRRIFEKKKRVEVLSHQGQVKNGGGRAMGLSGKKSLTLKKPYYSGLLKSLASKKQQTQRPHTVKKKKITAGRNLALREEG